jgi:acyl-CoA thioesterase
METELTIRQFFQKDRFALAAGVELTEVRAGYAKARMKITEKHLNGAGTCQGGAIFTLADLAFAAAVNTHAKLTISITSTISFHKAEKEGYLYAEAIETLDRQRIAHCEVRITNEAGEQVAAFTGTGYRINEQLPYQPLQTV